MSTKDSQQLQRAVKAQYEINNRDDITDDVVREIKASVIFQYRWEDLLQSGPVALTCLGNCMIASSSEHAALELEPPRDGFKFLGYKSLDANLVQSVDLGRSAFLKAEVNMGFINDASNKIYNKVAMIMDILMDPPTARTQLEPQLRAVQRATDDCYEKAKEVDEKFETWLNHAMELHASCLETQSTTEERLHATQLNMAVAQSRFEKTKTGVDMAKAAVDQFGKQVDLASEAYKKASDSFPNGWDILGQQVVGAIADTVTTAFGQVINNLAANMNPVARIESGVGMFKDLIHKKDIQEGKTPPTPEAPPAPKNPAPKDSTSPAYAEIKNNIVYLAIINAVLTKGENGGIDWEMAAGTDGQSDQSIFYALTLLEDGQKRFQQLGSGDEPSKKLENVLETAIKVAGAIQSEIKKSKGTSHKFPADDSDTVKRWKKSFGDAWETANKLAAVARTLPGTAANGAPIMTPNEEDPAVLIAKTNAKSAQAQAMLETAKNRLKTTQEHLKATQELYQKSSELLLEQQNKLAEIQGELTKLSETKLNLEAIKRVLVRCIELMVQLKQQIMNLCRFFGAVSLALEAVTKSTVTPFIEQIENATRDGGKRVGSYTLTDLTRTLIYQSAVTVRAYFSVFGDIASMWVKLSQDNIMPGLNIVDEMLLDKGNEKGLQGKVTKLQQWSKKAQDAIHSLAEKERNDILDMMRERVEKIEEVTRELPPAPVVRKVIEEGKKELVDTVTDALEHNKKSAPINRFGMKRV